MKKETIYVNLLDDRMVATKQSWLGIDFYEVIDRVTKELLTFAEAEFIENNPIWVTLEAKEVLVTPTILSFRDKTNGNLFTLYTPNNYYGKVGINNHAATHSKEFFLNSPHIYDIYQVQRNTDGEIFTLGDLTTKGKISEFKTIGCTIGAKINGGIENSLNHLIRAKALILTTVDGVKVYDSTITLYSYNTATGETNRFQPLRTKFVDNWIHFSTPESREMWIVKNLASFSYNDVMGFINTVMNGTINDIISLKTQLLSKSKDVYEYATSL